MFETRLEEAVTGSLDDWLLDRELDRVNCQKAPDGTCTALFVSHLDLEKKRFQATVLVSASAFHALPESIGRLYLPMSQKSAHYSFTRKL
eukprot:1382191-Pyramimonas_sp.AAC.1